MTPWKRVFCHKEGLKVKFIMFPFIKTFQPFFLNFVHYALAFVFRPETLCWKINKFNHRVRMHFQRTYKKLWLLFSDLKEVFENTKPILIDFLVSIYQWMLFTINAIVAPLPPPPSSYFLLPRLSSQNPWHHNSFMDDHFPVFQSI